MVHSHLPSQYYQLLCKEILEKIKLLVGSEIYRSYVN